MWCETKSITNSLIIMEVVWGWKQSKRKYCAYIHKIYAILRLNLWLNIKLVEGSLSEANSHSAFRAVYRTNNFIAVYIKPTSQSHVASIRSKSKILHTRERYFFRIKLHSTFQWMPRCLKWYLLFGFSCNIFICISYLLHACNMSTFFTVLDLMNEIFFLSFPSVSVLLLCVDISASYFS
jgi:hypothetical protein